MDEINFPGWQPQKSIQVIEEDGTTRVLVKGKLYMSWPSADEACLRLAMVQLHQCGLGTEEDVAAAFGRHINSLRRYAADLAGQGIRGLVSERRGPKGPWKFTAELRDKIPWIVLREGIGKLEAIQQRLAESWQEVVSVLSIHQVLAENGLGQPQTREVDGGVAQGELFDLEPGKQLLLSLVP